MFFIVAFLGSSHLCKLGGVIKGHASSGWGLLSLKGDGSVRRYSPNIQFTLE